MRAAPVRASDGEAHLVVRFYGREYGLLSSRNLIGKLAFFVLMLIVWRDAFDVGRKFAQRAAAQTRIVIRLATSTRTRTRSGE